MKVDFLGVAMLVACSAPAAPTKSAPTKNTTPSDRPILHGAAVRGPFPDEAALCQSVYEGQVPCLKRPSQRVVGPTTASGDGFARVELVDAGLYDDRCAIVFHIADRLYVADRPGLCLNTGHSLYTPTVREIAFRDLDGANGKELVIIADVQIVYDEVDDAPPRTSPAPEIPPLTLTIVCGEGGGTPSCVVATTKSPDEFIATHRFEL